MRKQFKALYAVVMDDEWWMKSGNNPTGYLRATIPLIKWSSTMFRRLSNLQENSILLYQRSATRFWLLNCRCLKVAVAVFDHDHNHRNTFSYWVCRFLFGLPRWSGGSAPARGIEVWRWMTHACALQNS